MKWENVTADGSSPKHLEDLTYKQIRDFIAEEVTNIVHQYPERSEALSKYIDPIGLSTEIRTSACKLCA